MRSLSHACGVLLLAITLGSTTVTHVRSQPAGEPQLFLHRTSAAPVLSGPVGATLSAPAADSLAIIQFHGPITAADRASLEQTGVKILEYLPDYAYLVRGEASQLAAVRILPQVYRQVPFTYADKLAPALLQALAHGDASFGALRVVGWPDDAGTLTQALRKAAIDPSRASTSQILLQIASLPSVRWIEPLGRPRLLNDEARTIMRVDPVWQQRGLFGQGQVVAIADSGLDTGNLATLSPDFAGRIVATHVISAGGDLADQFGHGTHVAGSVGSSGVQSGANPALHQYAHSFAGVAPEVGLVIQAFEAGQDGSIIGLPSNANYYPLFNQAYAAGARIHTNSWGDPTGPISDPAAAFGGYPEGSRSTDAFVWDHPDMTMLFAAGNEGRDGIPNQLGFCSGDGVVDSDSLMTPATAKNVITVGASENMRLAGGLSTAPWLLLNFCFASSPIAVDAVSNNANGMAAFSSRGPTDDGRTKPDIVAPGTNIISDRTHATDAYATAQLWGPHETNANYVYSGGTSMATPLVAGSAAIVRQWLVTQGIANPSAAAVKAALLNTSADMASGQYGTGEKQEIPSARPNSVAGWGRADLAFLHTTAPYALWVDDHTSGISSNTTIAYADTNARPLEIIDSSQPLRVMLAWTDPPASLSASKQLVNDLDLLVTGPGGTYHGNNAANGDHTNNVEGVIIPNPPVGKYTVQVVARNVPIASQPYALVVGGPIARVGQLSVAKRAKPADFVAAGGLITYTLSLSSGSRAITQTVVLTDTLPAQTHFVSASDGGTLTGPGDSIVRWNIPELAANATITRILVVRVDPATNDGTPIINADYRAENGIDLPGKAVSVAVIVGVPKVQTDRLVYLPLTVR